MSWYGRLWHALAAFGGVAMWPELMDYTITYPPPYPRAPQARRFDIDHADDATVRAAFQALIEREWCHDTMSDMAPPHGRTGDGNQRQSPPNAAGPRDERQ